MGVEETRGASGNLWGGRMLSWFREQVIDLLSRNDVGRRGERRACRFLRGQGLKVLARNVRAGRSEIDIIALDGPSLVFVEVKSRTGGTGEERNGLEKMDERKVRALRHGCLRYARRMSRSAESCRIDVMTVEFDRCGRMVDIRWYPGYLSL